MDKNVKMTSSKREELREIYNTIKTLWPKHFLKKYTEDLDKFLFYNPIGNESDFREIEKAKFTIELERMVPDLNFYTDNDDDQVKGLNLYDYWYCKKYIEYIDNLNSSAMLDPISDDLTGDERYLLDVNQIIKLYSLFKEFDIIETKVQFKEFLSRFDMNISHPTKLAFIRGGQVRFCYMLSQTGISEKDALKQFGIVNYLNIKKQASESRAIEPVFKRAVDRILNPSIKTEVL